MSPIDNWFLQICSMKFTIFLCLFDEISDFYTLARWNSRFSHILFTICGYSTKFAILCTSSMKFRIFLRLYNKIHNFYAPADEIWFSDALSASCGCLMNFVKVPHSFDNIHNLIAPIWQYSRLLHAQRWNSQCTYSMKFAIFTPLLPDWRFSHSYTPRLTNSWLLCTCLMKFTIFHMPYQQSICSTKFMIILCPTNKISDF